MLTVEIQCIDVAESTSSMATGRSASVTGIQAIPAVLQFVQGNLDLQRSMSRMVLVEMKDKVRTSPWSVRGTCSHRWCPARARDPDLSDGPAQRAEYTVSSALPSYVGTVIASVDEMGPFRRISLPFGMLLGE